MMEYDTLLFIGKVLIGIILIGNIALALVRMHRKKKARKVIN